MQYATMTPTNTQLSTPYRSHCDLIDALRASSLHATSRHIAITIFDISLKKIKATARRIHFWTGLSINTVKTHLRILAKRGWTMARHSMGYASTYSISRSAGSSSDAKPVAPITDNGGGYPNSGGGGTQILGTPIKGIKSLKLKLNNIINTSHTITDIPQQHPPQDLHAAYDAVCDMWREEMQIPEATPDPQYAQITNTLIAKTLIEKGAENLRAAIVGHIAMFESTRIEMMNLRSVFKPAGSRDHMQRDTLDEDLWYQKLTNGQKVLARKQREEEDARKEEEFRNIDVCPPDKALANIKNLLKNIGV